MKLYMLINKECQYHRDDNFPQLICRLNAISIKVPMILFLFLFVSLFWNLTSCF